MGGNISEKEMYSTFNMGVGMVLVVDEDEIEEIVAQLKEQGEEFILGKVEKGKEKVVLW